ncbi:MAG: hypothetical protein GSR81_01500 [Desulfurococcales archaeon]|nr:hypothetical protein [Desulfurococcales archaeon]
MTRTKKITIEVEVPEGISEEFLKRAYKAVVFLLASRELSKLLTEEDAKELAEAMEEALWGRLQS